MILDSKEQQQLLLGLISEHPFTVQGKQLMDVTSKIHTLAEAITNAEIQERENGQPPEHENDEETEAAQD